MPRGVSFLCLSLLICCGSGYNILMNFPVASKSISNILVTIGSSLAEKGHKVTLFTSFESSTKHPNLVYFRPDDYDKELVIGNFFDVSSHNAFLEWVNAILTRIPHKIWANEQVWDLYRRRNEFDAIISTSYANEALLPFLDGFNGTYVVICTSGMDYHCLSYGGNWLSPAVIPIMSLPYDDQMTFVERLHNSYSLVFEKLVASFVIEPNFGSVIKQYFPDFTSLSDYYARNSLTLINGHFSLEGPLPLLPNQVEVGPINSKDPQPLSKELQSIFNSGGDAGVIYFSLGSFIPAKSIPKNKKEILLEAFRRLPHQIIWKYEDDDLDLPPNVHIKKWLPQQDILGHPKTKVFMSHCGNLGTQEAKYHGVPVLALPITFDQPRNAARLERKKYAITVTWEEMTADKLVAAIHELTDDSTFYDRMKNISKIVKDQKHNPRERAAWWVEYVIKHGGAPHLSYAGKRLSYFQYIMIDVLLFWFAILILIIYTFWYVCKFILRKIFKSTKLKQT